MAKVTFKKKVIVACIGAVATSSLAAEKIEELARAHHLNVEICQCRIAEIPSNVEGACLIVPTARVKRDYGVPVVNGMPFVTGVGLEKAEEEALKILKEQ